MGFTNVMFLFYFFPLSILFYYVSLWMQNKFKILKKIKFNSLIIILISLVFYGWSLSINAIKFLLYILIVFCFGKLIEKHNKKSKPILFVGVFLAVGVLFFYKYLGLITDSFGVREIIAPIGISFITFSAISFLVDIYRGKTKDINIVDTTLYFTFFPKVISGPIVLWKDFHQQINNRIYTSDKILSGINQIIIGFCKKLILADSFGVVISSIKLWMNTGIDVLTAIGLVLLYFLQIYYDFSGYSDIALGLSKIFGFEFSKNFDFPYTSTSVTEFWRRWHISLGNWFKEYVYIPLGGNRKSPARTYINIFIVFLLTGVWHGAGLAYIVWGLLHGAFRLLEKALENVAIYKKIPRFVKQVFVLIIVAFGWEFFLFNDFNKVIEFNKIVFGVTKFSRIQLTASYFFDYKMIALIIIGLVGALFLNNKKIVELYQKIVKNKYGFIFAETVLFLLMFLAIMFMINSNYSPFIYFQY